ncbi:MAG: hypothetical protein JXA21_06875 [Anaerolineae bacterium]|nr:hypothetical protein [Anaerolineae bacterium]
MANSIPELVKELEVSVDTAIDHLCEVAGVDKQKYRPNILARLQNRANDKNGPLWAPPDLVFQPTNTLLSLLFLSIIVLAFVL